MSDTASRKDKDRLDWLSKRAHLFGDGKRVTGMIIEFEADGQWEDLRLAIDAAMEAGIE